MEALEDITLVNSIPGGSGDITLVNSIAGSSGGYYLGKLYCWRLCEGSILLYWRQRHIVYQSLKHVL